MNPKNILITSGRAPGSLELARIFFHRGHKVFTADSMKHHLCSMSRAVEKNFRVPKPRQETLKYIESLIKIIKEYKIEILIPTCEETFYISKYRQKLVKYCEVFVDDFSKLSLYHNKYTFIQFAKTLGLSVPRTQQITNRESANKIIEDSQKIVLKPTYSRYGEDILIAPQSINEFTGKIISASYPWVAQEYIKGLQYCSYSIARDGVVLASSVYPSEIKSNQVSLNFSSRQHPAIDAWIARFVQKTQFTGQISFDFIVRDNRVYAIECNPRMTSGIHLFAERKDVAEAITNNGFITANTLRPQKGISRMMALLVIIYGFKNFSEIPKHILIFFSAKDIIFNIRDPLPALSQFLAFISLILKSLKNNISLSKVTTHDIEWNGEAL